MSATRVVRLRACVAGARRSLWLALPAMVVWVLVQVLTFWLVHRQDHIHLSEELFRYDAGWYRRIAASGYDLAVGQGDGAARFAFFPLYPLASGALARVLPLSIASCLLLVAWPAALLAVWALHALTCRLAGRRAAFVAVVLWSIAPRSFVMALPYSESVLLACLAWSCHCLLRHRWRAAGILAALACLARPTSVVLLGTIVAMWLVAVVRSRRDDGGLPDRLDRGDAGGLLWALLPGCLSGGAWLAVITLSVRRLDAYFWIQQRFWAMHGGTPALWFAWVERQYTAGPSVQRFWLPVVDVGVVLLATLLALASRRLPWWLKLYSLGVVWVSLSVGSHQYSVPRFTLLAFPVWIPIAGFLAAGRWRSLVLVHAHAFSSLHPW